MEGQVWCPYLHLNANPKANPMLNIDPNPTLCSNTSPNPSP